MWLYSPLNIRFDRIAKEKSPEKTKNLHRRMHHSKCQFQLKRNGIFKSLSLSFPFQFGGHQKYYWGCPWFKCVKNDKHLFLWLGFFWSWCIGGNPWDTRLLSCWLSQQVSHTHWEEGPRPTRSPYLGKVPPTANPPTGPPAVTLPQPLTQRKLSRLPLIQCAPSARFVQFQLLATFNCVQWLDSSPPDLTPLTALSQCHKPDWWLKQPILWCKSSFETWWNDWRGFISSVDEKESLCTGAKAFKWRFGRWLNKLEWWQQCLEQLTFESRLLNSTNVDFLEGSVATLIINIILFALSLLSYHSSTTTLGFKLLLWAAFSSGLFQDLLSNRVNSWKGTRRQVLSFTRWTNSPSQTQPRTDRWKRWKMWPTIDFDADALPWSRPPVHWDWGCWGGGRDDSGEAEQKNLQHYTLPRADSTVGVQPTTTIQEWGSSLGQSYPPLTDSGRWWLQPWWWLGWVGEVGIRLQSIKSDLPIHSCTLKISKPG